MIKLANYIKKDNLIKILTQKIKMYNLSNNNVSKNLWGGELPKNKNNRFGNKHNYHTNTFISKKYNNLYNAIYSGIKKMATIKYLNFMNANNCFYDNKIESIYCFV